GFGVHWQAEPRGRRRRIQKGAQAEQQDGGTDDRGQPDGRGPPVPCAGHVVSRLVYHRRSSLRARDHRTRLLRGAERRLCDVDEEAGEGVACLGWASRFQAIIWAIRVQTKPSVMRDVAEGLMGSAKRET